MANGQFHVADVVGNFRQGQQFAVNLDQQQALQERQAALAPLKLQSAQLGVQQQQQVIDQRTDAEKNKSLFNTALRVGSASDSEIIPILQEQIQRVQSLGGNASESERALELAQSGDFSTVRQGAKNLIEIGVRQGDINAPKGQQGFTLSSGQQRFDAQGNIIAEVGPSEQQQQSISIRQQEAELRAAELEDKKLERKIKIETNQLKKDELKTKLAENKVKAAQSKRDIKFNAQSSVDAVTNSIDTIDRMLKGDGLESAAGFQANFPTIAGTAASDFEATLDTFQSQAFLSQVEKMKGLGALSENEGKKLGAALGSLSINQSDAALRAELGRIKGMLNKAKKRMNNKFGISATKTGELNADELAELNQLRAELGGQ